MRRLFPGLGLGVLLSFGRMLGAQSVRGQVRDSATSAPLPGAVVAVLDSAGAMGGARTITDAAGTFRLTVSAKASRLRVIHIGYRPLTIPIPAASTSPVVVSMVRLPPMLEAVRVSGQALCPGSADRGPAFQLWEEARAGLLATVVAREANPAMATTLAFKRQITPRDDVVQHQETKLSTGRTTRPFIASASASVFAEKGYVIEHPDEREYFAPDADVLLDEAFASTHCFQLRSADAAHAGQIGLAFAPVPGRNAARDSVVEVTGVIWTDRVVPQLRSLDFRYTELEPEAMSAGAGGHLEFRTVANGASFIERWWLRLPILAADRLPSSNSRSSGMLAPRRQERRGLRLDAIDETGGLVLSAQWDDRSSWALPRTGLTGRVVQGRNGPPVSSGYVALAGTSDTAAIDSLGRFTMTPVLPGRYRAEVMDTTLAAFVRARGASQVVDVARDSIVTALLEVASLSSAIERLCSGHVFRPDAATLLGRVRIDSSGSLRGARVKATWLASVNLSGGVSARYAEDGSEVDDAGRFAVCGVKREQSVHLELTLGRRFADTTITMKPGPQTVVDWLAKLIERPK